MSRRPLLRLWILSIAAFLLTSTAVHAQVQVVPPNTVFQVEWNHDEVLVPGSGPNRYRLKVDGVARDLVASDLTITGTAPNRLFRATNPGVAAGDHTITVCAFNDIGERCVPTVAFKAGAPPNAPTNFRFVVSGTIASTGAVNIERFEVTPETPIATIRLPR